ncbi:hypothetical protein B0T17DRAFT_503769 [Bombardia bombarda]|uniref:C3H1-type domain-containing protein n=1 Tax=Bombardia bombarda TaxID=252184 RepID=A0AA39XLM5_9PEZI|nr:hypothetical protein B0T17DRAFT_503769 [Bombardia bombarda]
MDQSHANGIEWDPNNFSENWDHHQFNGGPLGYDPNPGHTHGHGPDASYHNPDSYLGSNSQINPQLAGQDAQPDIYRSFDYYQPPNEGWPGPASTTMPYGHEGPLSQGYYASHPQNDVSRTVESRFALVDIPQPHQYPEHHLPVSDNQEPISHPFSSHVVNEAGPANGYLQGTVPPHWQRIHGPSPGYAPHQEYENPLASSQVVNLQGPGPRASPSPYSSVQGPISGGIQNYQAEAHQPVDVRQAQVQYMNGQQPQNHASVAELPVPRSTASPHVVSQPMAPKPTASQQTTQQPVSQQPAPHQSVPQQSLPQQPPVRQRKIPAQQTPIPPPSIPMSSQSQTVHQPVQPSENIIPSTKRRLVAEVPESKVTVKKARTATGPVTTGSPPQSSAQIDNSVSNGIFHVDRQLLDAAEERPQGTWSGVPYLVIGEAPVKLKKGAPTKRYVVLAAKGGRDPLFPDLARGWTPAESLGHHADAYQAANNELERQRADIRLEIELKRGGNEIPVDWWKKLPKGDSSTDAKRTEAPPEPTNIAIKASESVRLHPSHKSNQPVMQHTYDDYYTLLLEKATEFKNAPAFDRFGKVVKARAKNPSTYNKEFATLSAEIEPLRSQLQCAIDEGVKGAHPWILRKMEKTTLPVRLLNILIHLINWGESNSPLAKAILRLLGCFTNVRHSRLESWKFPSTKAKLEAQGDSEVKGLIAVIIANAEKNANKEPSAAESKAAPLKENGPGGEVRKGAKAPSRTPSGSLGSKRPREDDAGESRVSKKPTTETKPSTSSLASNGKMASAATKLPSTTIKTPSSKSSTASPLLSTTTSQPKPRPGLLLPGKAVRTLSKPAQKPDPAKSEATKTSVKLDPLSKSQQLKAEGPKLPISRPQASQTASSAVESAKAPKSKATETSQSGPSRFAALLAEIAEPKKVKASVPTPVSTPDPDETEEQKARRLRKEERRRLNLKVTFRADDRLVEVREFTRDPEEFGGRPGAAGRDVRSDSKDKMEGMALKKGHAGEIRPWEEPSAIDLSVIPHDKRVETFASRGGAKSFQTEGQRFMEDREAKELMVIYTDPSDIPPTPKSPPYEPTLLDEGSSGADVHLPQTAEYDEVEQRAKDRSELGLLRAVRDSQSRLAAQSNPDYADFTRVLKSVNSIADTYQGQPTPKPEVLRINFDPAMAETRDQQTYLLVISDRVRNYQDREPYDADRPKTVRRRDYPDPEVQKAADYVEETVEQFPRAAVTHQPNKPAEDVVMTEAATPPTATTATAAAPDYSAAWAQYYAQQAGGQPQQQQQAWYGQQQNVYTQAVNPYLAAPVADPQHQSADAGNQLSAILAALGNQSNVGQPQAASADSTDQIQALVAALANNGQGQGQAALPVANDPQGAEYLLSIMKWAQGQIPGQASGNPTVTAAGLPTTTYSQAYGQNYGQPPQHERDGYGSNNNAGANSGSNSSSRPTGERDHHTRGGGGSNGGPWESTSKSQAADIPEHLRGINRSLIGTKQCSFYARGACAKGDKCTFRHD